MSKTSDIRAERRRFMKTVAAATAGGAVAALPMLSHSARKPRSRAQYGMLVDLGKCVGCQSCSVACPLVKNA